MPQQLILYGRLLREFETVRAMVEIYCRQQHRSTLSPCRSGLCTSGPCTDCAALLEYAKLRLDRCPYGEAKPTCNRCPIHCYKPEPKQHMQAIMRYAGPRMLLHHPILAIKHLLYERAPLPEKPEAGASNRSRRLSQSKHK
ncbi:nitrous oxide-stimulated promoter family protein [Aliagarivorans marinus]|uniref:nitrous oxide-stimulated promoter family protein n=1 Tax=Aliagarivorans marinus TaxID=561965 RepID=UPI0005523384|nr:nitrous oxide-stimulated promoter family protein [Aliagarivorans marinus]